MFEVPLVGRKKAGMKPELHSNGGAQLFSEKIRAAKAFAREIHRGQKRNHGTDYEQHPEDVAGMLVFRYGVEDEEVLCAALLHDVIEDSDTNARELSERFGDRIAGMVEALSRDKSRPYSEYVERMVAQPPEVALIKAADVLSNLRDSALADGGTRRRAIRIAAKYILPMVRKKLSPGHPIVHDLEIVLNAVRQRTWFPPA